MRIFCIKIIHLLNAISQKPEKRFIIFLLINGMILSLSLLKREICMFPLSKKQKTSDSAMRINGNPHTNKQQTLRQTDQHCTPPLNKTQSSTPFGCFFIWKFSVFAFFSPRSVLSCRQGENHEKGENLCRIAFI